ncbi:MAG: hypothetical protein R3B06_21605 [Kofleriaceae bacterium]
MSRRAFLSSLAPFAVGLGLAVIGGSARSAAAQPKPKVERACNVSAIPLSVGNSWTYEQVQAPPEFQLSPAAVRFTPFPPAKLVIKVTAVETTGDTTKVTLSEDSDGRVHSTWVTCTRAGGFQVAPDSFWFNGEPGTTFGLELGDVARPGKTLFLAGGKLANEPEWHDDMTATWKHAATAKAAPPMRSGTLSVTRRVVTLPSELVSSKAGQWKATKLGIENTIVVTITPEPPAPLKVIPPQVSYLYVADKVGVVQVINSFGQMFVLTDVTVQ